VLRKISLLSCETVATIEVKAPRQMATDPALDQFLKSDPTARKTRPAPAYANAVETPRAARRDPRFRYWPAVLIAFVGFTLGYFAGREHLRYQTEKNARAFMEAAQENFQRAFHRP
jgi:hypothetical protein